MVSLGPASDSPLREQVTIALVKAAETSEQVNIRYGDDPAVRESVAEVLEALHGPWTAPM